MIFYSCKQGEELLIERLGRYHKTVSQPGFGLKSPFDRVAACVNTQATQMHLSVQFKTSDDIFAEMTAGAALRIVDSKQFHYGAADAAHQLGLIITAAIRQETAALTVAEAADCSAALDRIVAREAPRLRRDYGVELTGLTQKNLNLPDAVKQAIEAAGITLRAAAEKAKDASDASAAMQQGLQNDVRIGKPLVLKKISA